MSQFFEKVSESKTPDRKPLFKPGNVIVSVDNQQSRVSVVLDKKPVWRLISGMFSTDYYSWTYQVDCLYHLNRGSLIFDLIFKLENSYTNSEDECYNLHYQEYIDMQINNIEKERTEMLKFFDVCSSIENQKTLKDK